MHMHAGVQKSMLLGGAECCCSWQARVISTCACKAVQHARAAAIRTQQQLGWEVAGISMMCDLYALLCPPQPHMM
jgi:hypothetical protein